MLTLFAVNIIDNTSNLLNKVNLSNPTWDIFLVLFFITFAFFYGLFLGRDRIVQIIISIFFSYVLVMNMSFLFNLFTKLTPSGMSILKVTLFALLIFINYFFIAKKSLLSSISSRASSWWHVVIYSVIHTGLLISLAFCFINSENLEVFGKVSKMLFITPQAVFIWGLLSVFSLIFLKKSDY